jgi:asparagine synthase (glutamine-hydrolysing)
MTVLAALWYRDGRPYPYEPCRAMLRAQGRRSPFDVATLEDGPDLGIATGRDTPVIERSSEGRYSLLADIRLDNRDEFSSALGLTRTEIAKMSDAYFVLRCVERWGTEVVGRLIGDFALVLWDRQTFCLTLARDFAGQRPLHFHDAGGALAVASMAKGLHAVDFVPRGVDNGRLLEILAGQPHSGARTCFEGIQRVQPGEEVTFHRKGRSARFFWTPDTTKLILPTHDDYAESLLELLDLSVSARLRSASQVVGTHLSAGLDSSAVTTSTASQFAGKIVAFTSVPPRDVARLPSGRFGDERTSASEIAAMYPRVEHRLIRAGDRLAFEHLAEEHWHFERADLNLPNLDWSNRINEAASAAGINVMLTGAMGNATISFQAPSLVRRALPSRLSHAIDRFRNRRHDPLKSGVINRNAPGFDVVLRRANELSAPSNLDERLRMISCVDPGTLIKGTQLRWNLELLDPTADRRVVEFCLRVPLSQYSHGRMRRALIRTALQHRVPDSVRFARSRGMQSPHWFSMLTNSRPEARRLLNKIAYSKVANSLLDLGKMRDMLDNWPDQDGFGPPDYRHGLIRGLSIGEFCRTNER